jgi:hypothetical protein
LRKGHYFSIAVLIELICAAESLACGISEINELEGHKNSLLFVVLSVPVFYLPM